MSLPHGCPWAPLESSGCPWSPWMPLDAIGRPWNQVGREAPLAAHRSPSQSRGACSPARHLRGALGFFCGMASTQPVHPCVRGPGAISEDEFGPKSEGDLVTWRTQIHGGTLLAADGIEILERFKCKAKTFDRRRGGRGRELQPGCAMSGFENVWLSALRTDISLIWGRHPKFGHTSWATHCASQVRLQGELLT